ncbi:MAG: fibronectin/fibrinogen-binding protein, partial [Parasporobacterium sp.]|nr:fibronectin/fibrinogen-binding protein [Parasporobacterium sp.]
MAFDGITVRALTCELNNALSGGRINKINQFEKEQLLITVKKEKDTFKLLISVNPALPILYLTDESRVAPMNAPAFCMLLRKYLQGGKIINVSQPGLERIINFEISHYNEMGDLCSKILTVEMMGKHSNIILRDDTKILDSIRHVSALVSSVREVLPGRQYFIPFEGDKLDPLTIDKEAFCSRIFSQNMSLSKAIYTSLTGISPVIAEEIIYRCSLDSDRQATSFTETEQNLVFNKAKEIFDTVNAADFCGRIYYLNDTPEAFSVLPLTVYDEDYEETFDSVSVLLKSFYSEKRSVTDMRQKTADLRQIVQSILSKDYKKYDLQIKQIKDTEKKEKYKTYGELLTAYGYSIENGTNTAVLTDFYTNEEVKIPLDPTISPVENGVKYFDKYRKLKRTYEALSEIIEETAAEIKHLESVMASLDTAANEADIREIKREMTEQGYIKNRLQNKKTMEKAVKSSPLHFISSDGFHMYVGKNNYQNEYITFKLADGGDWWFHAKKLPGSHVIVKSEGKELTDRAFEEAASLA